MLQDGVLLEQPGVWEGGQADGAFDEAALRQLAGTRKVEQGLLLQEGEQGHRAVLEQRQM